MFSRKPKKTIAGLAPKTRLVITDVTHAQYNRAVADAIKDFTAHNSPYLRGSAVIGVEGVQYVLLQTVVFLTRREIKIFPTRLEAQDWLASLN